ncbi:MAG: TaqI-like C-terminal specificity domain-containing protein [Bacteroidota bacterium]|nr:TaqI-like C-terminal specificity domain-containing protein [Bacteroidota bacterium]MDP4232695.1 TaqI-like C-terminal specificity domain-containing protein [Bacteroidota bacterium]MDP4243172.1 TaqI-like C-terminal specificity domain-containing protein [Bacteroidota bacterium]MDP4287629.1 TaqI-like C-terminal specificity domain-containing protein [Bacteroidota bacterium]
MIDPTLTPFEDAFLKVGELARQFEEHETEYLSPKYQESEVRTDFIDKFFSALGWDVRHERQTNPREQEVKVEKNPDSNSSGRRADYAFHLKPNYRDTVFFVEAKKPSVSVGNPDSYFQIVRYGRSAKTPVGVLTDFQEFHIVDCRYEPNIDKSFPSAQIKTFNYKDFLDRERFGDFYWLFSREAIEAGKLKGFALELPKQRGKGAAKLTQEEARPTDDKFLDTLEEYRLKLAKAFKKADESLDAESLTEATQKVIDRLVFIRFLEDRNIESDYIVDQIAAKKGGSWKSFIAWSKELDVKYNGVVFKPHDVDKPTFHAPDEKVFAEICSEISHHNSKYLFSYIPVELLGSIYERFLGKVVTVTAKRASIDYKPEVRKAGGVYYTPKYIVDYIVENTVGKILNPARVDGSAASVKSSEAALPSTQAGIGLTPKEVSKLRFADIACGSGSFLIAVYDRVLHHVESWYNQHPDEAKKAGCIQIDKGVYALSLKQKQQILLDNIYGVDIDPQAVEVAQLSLFLKFLESESGAGASQLSFERTKILPDLSKNIVCGNSLVEYDIETLFPLSDEEKKRINPFSFESSFRDVMRHGGFDAIVGNPPYRMLQPHNTSNEMLAYLRSRFFAADFKVDFFHLFLQRATLLLKNRGKLGYIIPSSILNNVYVEKLRKWLIEHSLLDIVAVHRESVFAGADVHTAVLVLGREQEGMSNGDNVIRVTIGGNDDFLNRTEIYEPIAQHRFGEFSGAVWNVLLNEGNAPLIQKMEAKSTRLGTKAKINRGLITGDRAKYFSEEKKSDKFVPILAGTDVNRYYIHPSTEYVLFQRPKTSGGCWDPEVHFAPHKLLIRQIGIRPTASLLEVPTAVTGNIFTVMTEDENEEKYILAILNSNLVRYYWQTMFADFKSSFPQVTIFSLAQVPIRSIATDDSENTSLRIRLVSLVDQMLATKKLATASRRDSEREQLQRKCDYLDGEIDKLVYQLYGLTEEEIRIVEGEVK